MIDPVNRGRPWTGTDRTGGPVDEVFDQLRRHIPGLIVERLEATHPADDDNVYFIGDEHGPDQIQLDTAPAASRSSSSRTGAATRPPRPPKQQQ